MPVCTQKFISREDLQTNPDDFYVFGDNYERRGMGGQAKEMRGEPNAIGVRTKMEAAHNLSSYMTDETFIVNMQDILYDFRYVFRALEDGKTVVFPEDGLGTGLAKLSVNAPKTLFFLDTLRYFIEETYC